MATRKRNPQLWSPTVGTTGWSESTLAEKAWVEARGATVRWAIVGAILGVLVGLVVFAPASWLASAIASATGQRLILADARGTVWSGSAVAVLAGGPDSRDATYLPGRLEWTLMPRWYGVDLAARQECCLNGTTTVQIRPGLGRIRATLVPRTDWVGQWPSAWLGGLGTPWNTLQLGGSFRLLSPGVTIESVEGRVRARRQGRARPRQRVVAPDHARHARQLSRLAERRRRHQHPDAAHGDDAGRPTAAERQRHLGSRRRQVPRRGARGARRRAGAVESSQHHRSARRRAIDHFDRMRMTSPSRANWPRKTGATAIAAALVVGSAPMGHAFAQGATPRFRGEPVTLNFVNADIEGVARAMSAILRQQFIVDPRVQAARSRSTAKSR